MTEKVKVPQVVADAYKDLEVTWSLTGIFKAVTADYEVRDIRVKTLVEWNEAGRDDEGAGLMQLLLGNYEIESEPLEVGDWVKFKLEGRYIYGQVDTKAFDDVIFNFFEEDGNKERIRLYQNDVTLMTPKEIRAEKERQLWQSIGREVGEFKLGDVYLFHNYVCRIDDKISLDIANQKFLCHNHGDIFAIYPVESFINFEEVVPNATTDN